MNELLASQIRQAYLSADVYRDSGYFLQTESDHKHTVPAAVILTSVVSGRGLKQLGEAICRQAPDQI